MLTCERCGAGLPADSEQCAYCGTISERARAALSSERARREQFLRQATAQQAMLRQRALSASEQAAGRALLWGIVSFVLVCVPIVPSLLSLMAFKRSQKSAREAGSELPTRGKVGLWIALVSGLGSIAFWAWVIASVQADDARVDARKTALTQQIAQRGSSATLDQPFACALAELFILNNGFAGDTSVGSFRNLDCAGAVRVLNGRAELGDFKLATSSTSSTLTATICFKHGERWFVERAGVVSCELK
jgi:ribosomal protein L40E